MPSRCINKRLVFAGVAGIGNFLTAPIWCVFRQAAPKRCLSLIFLDPDGDAYLASFRQGVHDLMTMNSTPGWNVVFDSRVSADNSEQIASGKGLDLVLCANDRHRAEQSSGINLVFRHTSSLAPLSLQAVAPLHPGLPCREG